MTKRDGRSQWLQIDLEVDFVELGRIARKKAGAD
jgi:hypothetical protein